VYLVNGEPEQEDQGLILRMFTEVLT
jgi:hypothetical protein